MAVAASTANGTKATLPTPATLIRSGLLLFSGFGSKTFYGKDKLLEIDS
jgi:hypothetical protein